MCFIFDITGKDHISFLFGSESKSLMKEVRSLLLIHPLVNLYQVHAIALHEMISRIFELHIEFVVR